MQAFKITFPVPLDCVNDPLDDNIDANLILEDGRIYVATLYTIANIQRLMAEQDLAFFLATDMVIVKDLTKGTIRGALEETSRLDEEGIKMTLSYIGSLPERCLRNYPDGASFDIIQDETL